MRQREMKFAGLDQSYLALHTMSLQEKPSFLSKWDLILFSESGKAPAYGSSRLLQGGCHDMEALPCSAQNGQIPPSAYTPKAVCLYITGGN